AAGATIVGSTGGAGAAAANGACSSVSFLRRNQGSGKRKLLQWVHAQPRTGRARDVVVVVGKPWHGLTTRLAGGLAPSQAASTSGSRRARRARIARRRCWSRAQAQGSISAYRPPDWPLVESQYSNQASASSIWSSSCASRFPVMRGA